MAETETDAGSWPSPFDAENFSDAEKARLEREKLLAETAKVRAETCKLQREISLGHWAFLIEPAKSILPALSILVSVLLGLWTLNAQLDKNSDERKRDRDTMIAGRLAEYEKTMIEGNKDQEFATRTAILTLRSLGEEAIPILIADIQLSPRSDMSKTIRGVILEMNEDSKYQSKISDSILRGIKYTIVNDLANNHVDVPLLREYVDLFVNSHKANRRVNTSLATAEVPRLTKIVEEVRAEIGRLPAPAGDNEAARRDKLRKDIDGELERLQNGCV